jgi:hypothetical protein
MAENKTKLNKTHQVAQRREQSCSEENHFEGGEGKKEIRSEKGRNGRPCREMRPQILAAGEGAIVLPPEEDAGYPQGSSPEGP